MITVITRDGLISEGESLGSLFYSTALILHSVLKRIAWPPMVLLGCGEFSGMKRFDARVAIIEKLKELGGYHSVG